MRASSRFAAALAVIVAGAALTACSPHASAPPLPHRAEPVVVTIVIDELAGWIAAERFPILPQTGGFARLRKEGTWATDMRYGHADTETAAGHAALYTGLTPRENGIYANDIPNYDPPNGKVEDAALIEDSSKRLVSRTGELDKPAGVSLRRLERRGVQTLADRLRALHPGATIVALSLKDRGSVFAAASSQPHRSGSTLGTVRW